MSFKKITNKEYEIQLNGRTQTIFVPFAKTQALFKIFISNGGVVDPTTGEIQTDILTLIDSFQEVANLLLTEYDDLGKLVKEGNCASLESADVIALFQLASEVLSTFILELTSMQKTPEIPNQQSEEENVKAKKTKASA